MIGETLPLLNQRVVIVGGMSGMGMGAAAQPLARAPSHSILEVFGGEMLVSIGGMKVKPKTIMTVREVIVGKSKISRATKALQQLNGGDGR